ncbi:lytic polysaccharide monooxygenase [Acidomyces richmondensis BFW]|nr:MAG: lytic polysaccharide monooxygenase [Acidomyces sp. 'richmondensis']KYG49263.1 lytic polysaccharide monooxygenase [Acidomyces richmondensis BFW]
MHCLAIPCLALAAALAALPSVSAHGYVSGVVSGGKWYPGASPNWFYESTKPQQAGWFALNQDLGFVAPDEYSDPNITCHKGATPGTTYIPVTAGDKIDLQWSPWPESHKGPVLDYLARCNGDCTKVNKNDLSFFKIDAVGLISDSTPPGTWASDKLIANNNTWTVKIPADIKPGNFVLRHEIIALHSAETADGAQNYPQCINLKITGSGTKYPCLSGASCPKGTALYKEKDPGILINIYTALSSYTIPGPKIWSGLSSKVKRVAQAFTA